MMGAMPPANVGESIIYCPPKREDKVFSIEKSKGRPLTWIGSCVQLDHVLFHHRCDEKEGQSGLF